VGSKAQWWALTSISRVGPKTVGRLLEQYGGLDEALEAGTEALVATGILRPDQGKQLTKRLARIEEWEAAVDELSMESIDVLTLDSEDYPDLLRHASTPPPLLFVRGSERGALQAPAVSIVGARDASEEGQQYATALAQTLAGAGVVVVSGMAVGIDLAAHEGALAGGGLTVGVLGCGLLSPRGPDPEFLEDVCRSGVVISELGPNAPPTVANLMARNRIVAALSRALVVVEFGATTGSVNAAANARAAGRPAFLGPIAATQPAGLAELGAGATQLGDPGEVGALLEALARPLPPAPDGPDDLPGGQLSLPL
jgi:DNA processing protein